MRFDPSAAPTRPIEVWHESRRLPDATPLDAYANCFVKRDRPSRNLQTNTPAPEPKSHLALRELRRRDNNGEEC